MLHLNPVLTLWTLCPTWQLSVRLIASILSAASWWNHQCVAPVVAMVKMATGKQTWCGAYSINNLLPLINKTATTWGVKSLIKVTGVGGRNSLKDRMWNTSSPLTDNLPSILVFHLGFVFEWRKVGSLGIVGWGGDVSSVARPVGVDEVTGIWQQFIRVGSKVVPLCLKQQQQQCSHALGHISCPNRNDLRITPEKSPWTSRYSAYSDTNKVKAAHGSTFKLFLRWDHFQIRHCMRLL